MGPGATLFEGPKFICKRPNKHFPRAFPPTTLVDGVWMGWGVDGVLVRRIRAKENPATLAGCGVWDCQTTSRG